MYMKRSVRCALNPKQLAVMFRDVGRSINYWSQEREVAVASPRGLVCQGWDDLPEWVRLAEVRSSDGDLILSIDTVEHIGSAEVDALFENWTAVLVSLVSYPVKPFPQRVFGIGWPKTGTTSLTVVLRMLGRLSWHGAPWVIGLKHATDEFGVTSLDVSDIVDYTAVNDLPVSALFKEMDEAFPGSLFILTTRSIEEWVESMSAHCERLIEKYGCVSCLWRWAHGAATLDSKMLRERYIRHNREVVEYFGDRKDLLVIDVTRGNPWKTLCDFLKIPEPRVPFPHLNRRPVKRPSASN